MNLMKLLLRSAILCGTLGFCAVAKGQYAIPLPPYSLAAGDPGSTAVTFNDPRIQGWASGFINYLPGSEVDDSWKQPTAGLGPAGQSVHDVVVLGRGGEITMTLFPAVRNGLGDDLAIFENGYNDTFLELAYVEVSSDGVNFVRFPGYSLTASPVGSYGAVQPYFVTGFAGKFAVSYGTPFDLQELQDAYDWVVSRGAGYQWQGPSVLEFSQTYADHLRNNLPLVDLDSITHIRLVDVVGDGSAKDALGNPIYDPYPTVGSAGFDLDAVAALNMVGLGEDRQVISFAPIPHQRIAEGSLELTATASSGLPVAYRVVEGPAMVSGRTLTFTGKGQVVIEATQAGDGVNWEAAIPVVQSFTIADERQHLAAELIPNIVAAQGGTSQLSVSSSSGLPVSLEVTFGPANVLVDSETQTLQYGLTTGDAIIRAFQKGGEHEGVVYAPAHDLYLPISIVAGGGSSAPRSYATYASGIAGLAGNPEGDTDGDGVANAIEFLLGTDPLEASSVQRLQAESGLDHSGQPALMVSFSFNPAVTPTPEIQVSNSLDFDDLFQPQLLGVQRVGSGAEARHEVKVAIPAIHPSSFIRLTN